MQCRSRRVATSYSLYIRDSVGCLLGESVQLFPIPKETGFSLSCPAAWSRSSLHFERPPCQSPAFFSVTADRGIPVLAHVAFDSPACKLQFNCLPRLNVCNDLAEAIKALDGKKPFSHMLHQRGFWNIVSWSLKETLLANLMRLISHFFSSSLADVALRLGPYMIISSEKKFVQGHSWSK